ncbi:MAG: tetratricopeptide repeat protein [Candidatus Hydrogenedentes bacterium]|nr:tetratricopeptide repeat protein [Candidatus Hydrogenedentota bacterium]
MIYYPKLWEFIDLLAIVLTLCAGGYLLRLRWVREGEPVPTPVALVMWMGAFLIYFFVTLTFFNTTPDERKLTILAWCLLFWFVPTGYFSWIVVTSFTERTIDRIGPLSGAIEAPSEFADARRLALRGDLDGAVRLYRTYADAQPSAFFEAARLLKSADRFDESILLFEEARQRFREDGNAWTEATYLLAKLYEVNLGNYPAAIAHFRDILQRFPSSRYGQLAVIDVARLVALQPEVPPDLDEEEAVKVDPFYDGRDVRNKADREAAKIAVPAGVPPDPFYRPRAKADSGPVPASGGNGDVTRQPQSQEE